MTEEVKFKTGEEVFVFKGNGDDASLNKFCGKGVVTKSELSDDLSYHGSPEYRVIYDVDFVERGSGRKMTVKAGFESPVYFRSRGYFITTRENYIAMVEKKIESTNSKIDELKDEIYKLQFELEIAKMY